LINVAFIGRRVVMIYKKSSLIFGNLPDRASDSPIGLSLAGDDPAGLGVRLFLRPEAVRHQGDVIEPVRQLPTDRASANGFLRQLGMGGRSEHTQSVVMIYKKSSKK
jgi:hypothetical protein